jgi:hypothetical protein
LTPISAAIGRSVLSDFAATAATREPAAAVGSPLERLTPRRFRIAASDPSHERGWQVAMKGRDDGPDIIGQQRRDVVRIACWENDK